MRGSSPERVSLSDGSALHETTVIAEGCAFEGCLKVKGAVTIHGAMVGTLICAAEVSVGPSGRILGEVDAAGLSLAGRIDGIVRVIGTLRVSASGSLQGHARYAALEVERGGVMNCSTSQLLPGECVFHEDD